jgi:putative endonuclease
MQSHQLGIQGEDQACRYLETRGYSIVERNWRYQRAEIDIIAVKGSTLAIVEVKTRSTQSFGDPIGFIGREKIELLRKAANAYVNSKRINLEVRFDFIGIVSSGNQKRLTHVKDACFIF